MSKNLKKEIGIWMKRWWTLNEKSRNSKKEPNENSTIEIYKYLKLKTYQVDLIADWQLQTKRS